MLEEYKPYSMIATTLFGLEQILAEELRELGAKEITVLNRAVRFEGDLILMYKANLWLRTALRVLKPIHTFSARNEDQLYREVQRFAWENILDISKTFAIDTVVSSQYFSHSRYAGLKTKDAIVDIFRKKVGRRPSVDVRNPDIRLNLHITGDQATLSMDSSGTSLHRRGYRDQDHRAPLNEVLAAGLIGLTGWSPDQPLIDPMCGSGTIPIEATLIAMNIPPGIFRENFGFQTWKDYSPETWHAVRNQAARAKKAFDGMIFASDISEKNLQIARSCIRTAGLQSVIRLQQKDFLTSAPPPFQGLLIMNPPYGERLEKDNIEGFYQAIGDQLKKAYTGYSAWILSSNADALKRIGLKAEERVQVFNGALACQFCQYHLYDGSKRER